MNEVTKHNVTVNKTELETKYSSIFSARPCKSVFLGSLPQEHRGADVHISSMGTWCRHLNYSHAVYKVNFHFRHKSLCLYMCQHIFPPHIYCTHTDTQESSHGNLFCPGFLSVCLPVYISILSFAVFPTELFVLLPPICHITPHRPLSNTAETPTKVFKEKREVEVMPTNRFVL